MIRVYLPETFIYDAQECDPDLWELWERITNLPRVRRGGGYGRWVDLSTEEARAIHQEADYRREYWLTDAYGVEQVTSHERSAGKAAERVAVSTGARPDGGPMMLCHQTCDQCNQACDRSADHPGEHLCSDHAPRVTPGEGQS